MTKHHNSHTQSGEVPGFEPRSWRPS